MALFDIFGGGNPTTDFTDAPSEADRKRALNMALMQAGAAILANNRGNYGALGPALGAGIQNGLLSYNYNYEKGQQAAAKRKQMEMQKKLFSESMTQPKPGEMPGTTGSFDAGRFAQSALANPEAGYADVALKALLARQNGTEGTAEMKNYQFQQGLPETERTAFAAMMGRQGSEPSAVQEYKFLQTLTPDQRKVWFENKRAAQIMNLGGTQAVRSPVTGDITETYPVTPKPGEMPAFQAAQETAKGEAKTGVERMAEAPKIKARIVSQDAKYKNLETTIDKALKNAGFWSTGVMAQLLSGVGGTTAKNLAATLDTVKANMGFDELQEMRNNSPTGGALGQVAVQEIQYLQSVIASLDQAQDSDQLKANLESIKQAKRESNARIRKAYEETYGNKQGSKPGIQNLW